MPRTVPMLVDVLPELRRIVATCRLGQIRGGLKVDLLTASAIVQVHDALGPEARAKFAAMDLLRAQSVAFRLIEKIG